MCRLGCTPVVMTRVVNWPGVARLIFRGNSDCTRSGRPRSRWSRITPSKNGPFDASNQNFATIQDLTGPNPSRVAVLTATQGLLAVTRASFAFNAQTLGILGREGYNLDVSNPQLRRIADLNVVRTKAGLPPPIA